MAPYLEEFGITRLARVTGLDSIGIPVWAAIRPNARTLAQSQGKGVSDDFAAASALMEAVELATAERVDLQFREATQTNMARDGVRYALMSDLLRKGFSPIKADETVSWIVAHDLATGESIFVPLDVVSMARSLDNPRYWLSTDGLASGNDLWEATLHGLCERIERDAIALFRLKSEAEVESLCVDPREFSDEALLSLARKIEDAGFRLRLFNLTSDTMVPVVAAFIGDWADGSEHNKTHFELSGGYGCHPAPVRAAIRAVTEAAQTRLTTISGARDDVDPTAYRRILDPSLFVYMRSVPLAGRLKPCSAPNGRDALLPWLLERLRDVGVEQVIVVPLENRDRGFAVARVLVPGLENASGNYATPYGPRMMRAARARK